MNGGVLVWSLIIAALVETVTVVVRFGFHRTAIQSTRKVSKFTFGYRIHHGYLGVLSMLLGLALDDERTLLLSIGLGLLLSDLLHHFVVLQLVTGKHEFSFRYPKVIKASAHLDE